MISGRLVEPQRIGRKTRDKLPPHGIENPHVDLARAIIWRAVFDCRSRRDKVRIDAFDFLMSDAGHELLDALGLDGDAVCRALDFSDKIETPATKQRTVSKG